MSGVEVSILSCVTSFRYTEYCIYLTFAVMSAPASTCVRVRVCIGCSIECSTAFIDSWAEKTRRRRMDGWKRRGGEEKECIRVSVMHLSVFYREAKAHTHTHTHTQEATCAAVPRTRISTQSMKPCSAAKETAVRWLGKKERRVEHVQ